MPLLFCASDYHIQFKQEFNKIPYILKKKGFYLPSEKNGSIIFHFNLSRDFLCIIKKASLLYFQVLVSRVYEQINQIILSKVTVDTIRL